jgi:hypothetical protein
LGLAAEDCMLARGDRDWESVEGACSTCRGTGGLGTICTMQQSASGPLVILGREISTLGFCSATIGMDVALPASG